MSLTFTHVFVLKVRGQLLDTATPFHLVCSRDRARGIGLLVGVLSYCALTRLGLYVLK